MVVSLARLASASTWDDLGCRPDDPKFDNGPALTKILNAQGGSLDVCPVGKLRDYYVATSVVWPARTGGALVGSGGYSYVVADAQFEQHKMGGGVTRLIWNGKPGQPMIVYRGCGGRIAQLVLQGTPVRNSTDQPLAGFGMFVESRKGPPSGKLVADQVAILKCDVGVKCANEPDANHADNMTWRDLMFHGCRVNYWVDGDKAVTHTFFNVMSMSQCQEFFRFDRGGDLKVFGCYQGYCADSTLLVLGTGISRNHWPFEIQGLRVDPTATRFRFLDSRDKFPGRVRISGSVPASVGLAEHPVVVAGRGADVRIDTTNYQWPPRAARSSRP